MFAVLSPGRLLLVALVVTLAVVAVGSFVLLRDPVGTEEPAEPATTPLAAYDVDAALPARAPFCAAIDTAAVEDLLGGEPTGTTFYGNGDQVPDRVGDVSHEFGCIFAGQGADRLRAWIFVPPIGDNRAQALVQAARERDGCEPLTGQEFGSPGVATLCQEGEVTTAVHQGRFGDAWVSCDAVTARVTDASALRDRAGRWCVEVLEAASAG